MAYGMPRGSRRRAFVAQFDMRYESAAGSAATIIHRHNWLTAHPVCIACVAAIAIGVRQKRRRWHWWSHGNLGLEAAVSCEHAEQEVPNPEFPIILTISAAAAQAGI